jgi:hypothetical protein
MTIDDQLVVAIDDVRASLEAHLSALREDGAPKFIPTPPVQTTLHELGDTASKGAAARIGVAARTGAAPRIGVVAGVAGNRRDG